MVDKRARFIQGDLLDPNEINKALKGIDRVFHFAAVSYIKSSIDDPEGCFRNNVMGTVNLLEGMRKNGVKFIVNSSSASVYGEPAVFPVTEDSVKQPLQPYGASKLAVEAVLSGYFHTFGINSTSLRYFNAYGPFDEVHPITRAVPNWIKQALSDQPISLYWKGQQYRDYIYVEDIARAHLAVMDLTGSNYFNIGTGKGILMVDLLESIFKAVGRRTEVTDLGERPGDPTRLVADTSKITKAVGWKPTCSLDEGIKITVNYFKNSKFK
ncbi:MAG: GDP-mannose 4,6-dehydratase [Deltaproteobacteria bacterium]|nr:GDP-mannose 4,6-dehydratase [Deltaproteobacteria bacterium]